MSNRNHKSTFCKMQIVRKYLKSINTLNFKLLKNFHQLYTKITRVLAFKTNVTRFTMQYI